MAGIGIGVSDDPVRSHGLFGGFDDTFPPTSTGESVLTIIKDIHGGATEGVCALQLDPDVSVSDDNAPLAPRGHKMGVLPPRPTFFADPAFGQGDLA
jgi:hypothetical protein